MKPDDYCAQQAGGPGSTLYYSLMFQPSSARSGVNAVYALANEIGDIADECNDPGVAHVKFDWWREELLRTYMGTPRHPVTQALASVITTYKIEHEILLRMVDTTEAAVGRVRFQNLDTLLTHCRHTSSTPAVIAATVLAGQNVPTIVHHAELLGIALRLTDILAHLGRDIRRDRLYLPLEDLRRFDVMESDLFAYRHTPAFESLMEFEIERTLSLFSEAETTLPHENRVSQMPGLVMAAIARAHLDELRRDGYRVLERRISLTPLRKLWISLRTRARANRRVRHAA